MRYLDYLAGLASPSTAQDARDRASLEQLLAGLEAHAGGPIDLTKARWPVVARRVLNAGATELAEIHRDLRGGKAPRDVFPPVPSVPPSE